MTTTDAAETSIRPGYRYYVLAILILVYMLNFLDRQIIGILAAPLKAHFQLSDSSSACWAASPSPRSIRPWPFPSPGWPTASAACGS
jgi:hypothetical protein